MNDPRVWTFTDVLDAVSDMLAGTVGSGAQETLRRAVRDSYRQLTGMQDWQFLHRRGRIQLRAAETLTAVFDFTGGANERQLTASAAFPDWVQDASVRMGKTVSDVDQVISSTVVTLDATLNPGQDVASGEVLVYPRWYAFPPDFMAVEGLYTEDGQPLWPEPDSRPGLLELDRRGDSSASIVTRYVVGNTPDIYGQMGLFVHPPSSQTETLDYVAKFAPRELIITGEDAEDYAGTVTVSSADPAVVTGSSTLFNVRMLGSIMRLGDTTNVPRGLDHHHRYIEQRSIVGYTSGTSLTLDGPVSTTFGAGTKYRIADPVVLDQAAYDALVAMSKAEVGVARNLENTGALVNRATRMVQNARARDSRFVGRQQPRPGMVYRPDELIWGPRGESQHSFPEG